MFTKDHANRLKSRAGQKYRPSNGTEGEMFMAQWCDNCKHDDPENDILCDIIAITMGHDVEDVDYPIAWQYGPDGQPICTAFKQDEQD